MLERSFNGKDIVLRILVYSTVLKKINRFHFIDLQTLTLSDVYHSKQWTPGMFKQN